MPLLIGAYFDPMDYGLVSSLGGLVFLYLPNTPLSHRMVTQMACAFAMTACCTPGRTDAAAGPVPPGELTRLHKAWQACRHAGP